LGRGEDGEDEEEEEEEEEEGEEEDEDDDDDDDDDDEGKSNFVGDLLLPFMADCGAADWLTEKVVELPPTWPLPARGVPH